MLFLEWNRCFYNIELTHRKMQKKIYFLGKQFNVSLKVYYVHYCKQLTHRNYKRRTFLKSAFRIKQGLLFFWIYFFLIFFYKGIQPIEIDNSF